MLAAAAVVPTPDAEATYALVEDAQHVAFLQHERRIYGSVEGAATAEPARLRLSLEEMAVGVAQGFLRLEAAAGMGEENRALVREIAQELIGAEKPRSAGTWRLSRRRRDRLRVFRDLWERGYIVTFGSKFGADFLIYKDNPKRAHAVALVVVKGYEEEFARVDVVSFCRVAKMVKKQLLFASARAEADGNDTREQTDDSSEGKEAVQNVADSVVYISLTHALLVSRQEENGEGFV